MDIDKIRKRIAEIEQALSEIKQELNAFDEPAKPIAAAKASPPDPERLRAEYRRLYQEFVNDGPQVVERFVAGKSEEILVALCRANGIVSESEDLTGSRASIRLMQAFAKQRAEERHRS